MLHSVTLPSTLWTALLLYCLGGLLLALLLLSQKDRLKVHLSRFLMFVVGSMGLVLLFGFLQWQEAGNRVEAIVQAERLEVRSSPGEEGVSVFLIHEGTKVSIDQNTDQWVEIVLPDGKSGWIPSDALEVI